MKYILLMSGTRAGVQGYHAWSKQDIEAHMAVLHGINGTSPHRESLSPRKA